MASKCLDNGLGVLYKKAGSDDLDKAYLVEDSTGNNQILVPELNDYCDIMADFKSKRSGDTLEIWFDLENAAVTNCMCIKDHLFSIKSSDADAKYFKYSGDVFAVTSEPAPERPEIEEPTIPDAPEFDESAPHQEVTDVIGQCDATPGVNEDLLSEKFRLVDGWSDFSEKNSDEKSTPIARTHVEGEMSYWFLRRPLIATRRLNPSMSIIRTTRFMQNRKQASLNRSNWLRAKAAVAIRALHSLSRMKALMPMRSTWSLETTWNTCIR